MEAGLLDRSINIMNHPLRRILLESHRFFCMYKYFKRVCKRTFKPKRALLSASPNFCMILYK